METDVIVEEEVKRETKKGDNVILILHNDDKNDIAHIENSLIDICDHSPEQAAQCAIIAHYKGSCDIKKGEKSKLLSMHKQFNNRGIITTVE